MREKLHSHFLNYYANLLEGAAETEKKIGEERAWFFINLANDWMDLSDALLNVFPSDEQREKGLTASLAWCDFIGIFQQIRWMQLLFLGGNYPLLYRNLRFVWEQMFRAYYVDTLAVENLGEQDIPGLTVNEKIEWLEKEKREAKLNRSKVIEPLLIKILPASEVGLVESYITMWEDLNKCVHPSAQLKQRMIKEPHLMVKDGFNREWAEESYLFAKRIFDLIWLMMLKRFPECRSHFTNPHTFELCPLSRTVLEEKR